MLSPNDLNQIGGTIGHSIKQHGLRVGIGYGIERKKSCTRFYLTLRQKIRKRARLRAEARRRKEMHYFDHEGWDILP
jgi:hypothetical protein